MKYSMKETARWMLADALAELRTPTMRDARGVQRPKTKARERAQHERVALLCELFWNARGRPGDLRTYIEAVIAGERP